MCVDVWLEFHNITKKTKKKEVFSQKLKETFFHHFVNSFKTFSSKKIKSLIENRRSIWNSFVISLDIIFHSISEMFIHQPRRFNWFPMIINWCLSTTKLVQVCQNKTTKKIALHTHFSSLPNFTYLWDNPEISKLTMT